MTLFCRGAVDFGDLREGFFASRATSVSLLAEADSEFLELSLFGFAMIFVDLTGDFNFCRLHLF